MIFLTAADLLYLDYLNLSPASVLRPPDVRHYRCPGPSGCLCGNGRLFIEDSRRLQIHRCPLCELEDIHAWLSGDYDNTDHQHDAARETWKRRQAEGKQG
jgi:hypothetical protein